jgi:single-stranded-DNA-specific exonuclease
MLWKYRTGARLDEARKLSRELGKPLKYCELLLNRGFRGPEEIESLTRGGLKNVPLPETMPGVRDAVRLFLNARQKGDAVGIFGDYDADGLTATAALTRVLVPLGYSVVSRIPNRLSDGYGLSPEGVRDLHDRGARLLVTVDCGVSDLEAVRAANSLNLPVVVTDHHRLPPVLPPAQAIINPHLGSGFEAAPLAGVGVAFMLAWAVQRALKAQGLAEAASLKLEENLALVALGTIADMAPLTGLNRALVRSGLKFLAKSPWPGLKALKAKSGIEDGARVSARDVGFRLAPKLNAAGRMGSAEPALEILTTADAARAEKLAARLEALNRSRYEGQMRLLEAALEKLGRELDPDSRTVVLAEERWPRGLLGLAASRIVELTRKPTVLLSVENGVASGSGRGAPGFNLFAALSAARELCLSMGGHSEAAGVKLLSERIPAFKEAFEKSAARQPLPPPEGEILIDFEADISDLPVLTKAFADLEPFGQGHPAPNAVLRNIRVTDAAPTRTNGDKHMVLRVNDGPDIISLVGFNMAGMLGKIEPVMDLVFSYDGGGSHNRIPGWRFVDLKSAGAAPSPW